MVKTLLRNFINQEKCPSELYKNTTDSVSAIASATASLACKFFAFLVHQGSHMLEKYLKLENFLEKSLKYKSALKSTGKSLKGFEKSLNSTIFCRTLHCW